MSETTWDTDEIERWVLNDEGIYFTFHHFATGRFLGTAGELREFFTEYPVEGVDLDEVDWDQVVEDLEDE